MLPAVMTMPVFPLVMYKNFNIHYDNILIVTKIERYVNNCLTNEIMLHLLPSFHILGVYNYKDKVDISVKKILKLKLQSEGRII